MEINRTGCGRKKEREDDIKQGGGGEKKEGKIKQDRSGEVEGDKKKVETRGRKKGNERKRRGRKRGMIEGGERSVRSLGISAWYHVTSDGMYSGNGHAYISLLPLTTDHPLRRRQTTFVEAFADRDAFYATCLLSR